MPPLRHSQTIFTELPNYQGEANPYLNKIRHDPHLPGQYLLWGSALKDCAGSWQHWFAAKATGRSSPATLSPPPLVVEIGCHRGHVLAQMATHHPQCSFIGLDITLKRVYESARRLQQQDARHGCVVYCNAKHLQALFAPQEIHTVIIFFPDPWAKKSRQKKHRLLNPPFIQRLYELIIPGGFVWFKTDCQDYFAQAALALNHVGFQPSPQPHPVLMSPDQPRTYESPFERRFRAQNKPVFNQLYQKPP